MKDINLFCKKVTFITSTRRVGEAPRTSGAPGTWTGRCAASASRRTGCGRGAGRTHPCRPADPQQAAPPPRSLCPENTPKYICNYFTIMTKISWDYDIIFCCK